MLLYWLYQEFKIRLNLRQRSVWPETQSIELTLYTDVLKIKTFNCCETKLCKNYICLLFTTLQIHDLATLVPDARTSKPQSSQIWICKCVINKQMTLLQNFVSQQLLFLFSKHLDTMSNRLIVSPVKQIVDLRRLMYLLVVKSFFWTGFRSKSMKPTQLTINI